MEYLMVHFERRSDSSEASLPVYRAITSGVEVSVTPRPFPRESTVHSDGFPFLYTIGIANCRDDVIQLMSRSWSIYSGGELFDEVTGLGVVGEQPVLRPGERFEYSSSAVIEDPVGSMVGQYVFVDHVGDPFSVVIPEFALRCDEELH
jgi:ApaG protein